MIHSLVVMQAYADARRRILTRRCPQCGHEQLTPEEKLNESVPCEKCKTPMRRSPGARYDLPLGAAVTGGE